MDKFYDLSKVISCLKEGSLTVADNIMTVVGQVALGWGQRLEPSI
jgi:hypothetical protein